MNDKGRTAQLFELLKRFDGQVLLTMIYEGYIPLHDDRQLRKITADQVTSLNTC